MQIVVVSHFRSVLARRWSRASIGLVLGLCACSAVPDASPSPGTDTSRDRDGGGDGSMGTDDPTWAAQDAKMQELAKDVQKWCGGELIPTEWDKPSFSAPDWNDNSPSEHCAGVYNSLRSYCSGIEGSKRAIQDQVKKVVCRYGGKGEFGLALSDGALTYDIDPDETGVATKIDDFIKHNVSNDGETIADMERWRDQDGYMASTIADANKKCQYDDASPLVHEWDKASFASEDWSAHSPNSRCAVVYTNIASICSTFPDKQAPMRAKIKKVRCGYAGEGNPLGLALSAGTLTYSVDWDENNPDPKITTFLNEQL